MVIDLELPAAAPHRLSAEAGGYEGHSSADQHAAETEGEDGESEEQLILTLTVEFFDVIRSTICRFSQPVSRCRGVTDPVLPARQFVANSSAGLHRCSDLMPFALQVYVQRHHNYTPITLDDGATSTAAEVDTQRCRVLVAWAMATARGLVVSVVGGVSSVQLPTMRDKLSVPPKCLTK